MKHITCLIIAAAMLISLSLACALPGEEEEDIRATEDQHLENELATFAAGETATTEQDDSESAQEDVTEEPPEVIVDNFAGIDDPENDVIDGNGNLVGGSEVDIAKLEADISGDPISSQL